MLSGVSTADAALALQLYPVLLFPSFLLIYSNGKANLYLLVKTAASALYLRLYRNCNVHLGYELIKRGALL